MNCFDWLDVFPSHALLVAEHFSIIKLLQKSKSQRLRIPRACYQFWPAIHATWCHFPTQRGTFYQELARNWGCRSTQLVCLHSIDSKTARQSSILNPISYPNMILIYSAGVWSIRAKNIHNKTKIVYGSAGVISMMGGLRVHASSLSQPGRVMKQQTLSPAQLWRVTHDVIAVSWHDHAAIHMSIRIGCRFQYKSVICCDRVLSCH